MSVQNYSRPIQYMRRSLGNDLTFFSNRKFQYEEEVKENPMNYDAWFCFIRLVESEGNIDIRAPGIKPRPAG